MEERGVESPLLREESALNSISVGFPAKRTGWEGWSALSSIPGEFGCQEDRFTVGDLAPKGSSCASMKCPRPGKCQDWHGRAQGQQEEGYKIEADLPESGAHVCLQPQLLLNCPLTLGWAGRIPSGRWVSLSPRHGILHHRFCKWSERYEWRFKQRVDRLVVKPGHILKRNAARTHQLVGRSNRAIRLILQASTATKNFLV